MGWSSISLVMPVLGRELAKLAVISLVGSRWLAVLA
jgi:hypothetical protein